MMAETSPHERAALSLRAQCTFLIKIARRRLSILVFSMMENHRRVRVYWRWHGKFILRLHGSALIVKL